MFKFSGVLLLSLTVSCIGFFKYLKFVKRVKYLEAIKQFAHCCADDMRFSQKNVFSILEGCNSKELSFFKEINSDNISDAKKIQQLTEDNGIEERDRSAFCLFLQSLGSSDIEGQKLHCKYYFELFNSMLSDAKNEQDEQGRIYKSMYLFAGIALFIILI